MKIHIEENNHKKTIIIPNSIAFNRFSARIASISDKNKDLSPDKYAAMFLELRQFARKHPQWVLVEVEESSGNMVKITL